MSRLDLDYKQAEIDALRQHNDELREQLGEWRVCAENLIDYARQCLANLSSWGSGYQRYEREMDTIRKDIAEFDRLKEASK